MAQTNKKYYLHSKRDHVLMASRNHFYLQLRDIPWLAFSVVCAKLQKQFKWESSVRILTKYESESR